MRRWFFVAAIMSATGILSMHYPRFLGDAWALVTLAATPLTKEPQTTAVIAAVVAVAASLMGLAVELVRDKTPSR